MIALERFQLEATRTGQPLSAVLYGPETGETRGTLFLIHGMSEHAARYHKLADYLAANGYGTVLFDLPGHGETARQSGLLGCFADKGGADAVIGDLFDLIALVDGQRQPDTPFILFGHSMGSMLARLVAARRKQPFDAVVLSGTMGKNPMAALARRIAGVLAALAGPRHISRFLTKLSQKGYLDRFGDVRSTNDWLSRDREHVAAYDADPLCGFPFTVSGWRDLLTWLIEISGESAIGRLPETSRYYVFSGSDDPVGGFGQGVGAFVDTLRKSGRSVTYRLYEGGRHEMINELNREEVFAELVDFLNSAGTIEN